MGIKNLCPANFVSCDAARTWYKKDAAIIVPDDAASWRSGHSH
jgi:hypothetical protein